MDIKKYTSIIQAVLKFVGFYPISMPRYLTCVSCIVLMIVAQIVTIYKNWNDLDTVLDISSSLLTIALAVLKSIIWMFNRKSLEYFVNFMLTSYWNIVKVDVFIHLQEYAIYAKYISKGYLVSMFNTLLFYSSLPIIEVLISKHQDSNNNFTMKNFPFTGAAPVAFDKFPFYQIIYIHQVLATNICALFMLATDALIASALLHTCGHFAVLKQQLKELDSCIYCVSTALTEHSKLITSFSHLIVALFQLLLFCFPGDILMRQSTDISTAVYTIQWYKLPRCIKDEVCMIILRSQKPCSITAGKLYVMHLENFSAILSTAFSYFMMLRSFNSEV